MQRIPIEEQPGRVNAWAEATPAERNISLSDETAEFDDSGGEASEVKIADFGKAVLHATDWTTETLVSQLRRENIHLRPRFQRRDAWSIGQKSRFIESLILGLPVPQIVLAEAKDQRGRYLVLDGKQRLLSLLQFWSLGEGKKNSFSLSGLQILTELSRQRLSELENNPRYVSEYDALLNQTIRTVVIRNWPDSNFLHEVFLRLNTGSTKLSPQELRQALQPGPFADWVDEEASKSEELRGLLRISEPDFRMRDTEILARFVAFSHRIVHYRGRLKSFLDETFAAMNDDWESKTQQEVDSIQDQIGHSFAAGMSALNEVFGPERIARRPGSTLLNRTLLDMLLFFASDPEVAEEMKRRQEPVRDRYDALFSSPVFVATIDSDTAGLGQTVKRFNFWQSELSDILDCKVPHLDIDSGDGNRRSIVVRQQ